MLRLSSIILFLSLSQVNASFIAYDGCYQLADSNGLYPVVCLNGTGNEAGAFDLALVGPNSTTVRSCTKHYAMVGDLVGKKDGFEVYSGGGAQLQMAFRGEDADLARGKVKFPSGKELDFFKLEDDTSSEFMNAVYDSGMCN